MHRVAEAHVRCDGRATRRSHPPWEADQSQPLEGDAAPAKDRVDRRSADGGHPGDLRYRAIGQVGAGDRSLEPLSGIVVRLLCVLDAIAGTIVGRAASPCKEVLHHERGPITALCHPGWVQSPNSNISDRKPFFLRFDPCIRCRSSPSSCRYLSPAPPRPHQPAWPPPLHSIRRHRRRQRVRTTTVRSPGRGHPNMPVTVRPRHRQDTRGRAGRPDAGDTDQPSAWRDRDTTARTALARRRTGSEAAAVPPADPRGGRSRSSASGNRSDVRVAQWPPPFVVTSQRSPPAGAVET